MIDLDERSLGDVCCILRDHVPEATVLVFGSRVSGRAMRFSDLDLALVGETQIAPQRIEALKDAFAESNLPIMVDVVDIHAVSPEFRRIIEGEHVVLQQGDPKP